MRGNRPQAGMVQLVLLLLSFSTLMAIAQQSTPSSASTGSVSGTILDDKGKPLADARVYGNPEKDIRWQFHTQSDADGRFALPGLPEGLFYLSAFKESDGYPYNFFSFFVSPGENTPIKVQIKPGEEVKNIRIQMGERAARLNVEIIDEAGKPLEKGASLSFTRPDQPERPYGQGARSTESLLVPPVPFHLKVFAKGYKDWDYSGSPSGLLTLNPGQTFDLTVRLQKAP